MCPDYLVYGGREEGEAIDDYWKRVVKNLKPGVTELYIHAALPGEEIKHITDSWETRVKEYNVFTNDSEMKQIIEDEGIVLIGYRELRELQRSQ